jgi:hypothetical protein
MEDKDGAFIKIQVSYYAETLGAGVVFPKHSELPSY